MPEVKWFAFVVHSSWNFPVLYLLYGFLGAIEGELNLYSLAFLKNKNPLLSDSYRFLLLTIVLLEQNVLAKVL